MNRLRISFLSALIVVSAAAAPAPGDLGQGLAYFRVHEVPLELPAAAQTRPQACVLDLRYARGDSAAAVALEQWLKSRATPRTPVFVLANGDTAPPLLTLLADGDAFPGAVVIGVASRGFRPALAVPGTAENERRAYDAVEKGATLASLLVENPDKVRNDEASLSKDRLGEAGPEAGPRDKNAALTPPLDAALQRAVHLHRALRALKKI